ncbi:type II toxin-antitoxin system RelE/ParE family toxin [Rufibacter sp. XAAS-G3-1]|uniref:type II toxin-antitoxin system RelE/ParE family toxin n=1 Tax=Rufibacter sp. XAAS-G3-1 TaxID=2729134 RepID=UPI0015E79A66|nr:type II toxin-antitoxin system RelE/ParE family toxin [Rufibacter sp. XAAS-G3-1]
MAQVIWNKRASRQLAELQSYLHEEFGENAARTFTIRIFNFLELLVKYPKIGSLENPEKDIRGFLLHRHTTILYKHEQDIIYILSLFDNRQNQEKKKL